MINKKNFPLVIALSIPLLMILLVASFIYFPGIGKSPKHNFVYLTGDSVYYGYSREYKIVNGRLIHTPLPPGSYPDFANKQSYSQPSFYLYDVKSNTSKEISYSEAQNLNLDPSNISPDNYVIERGNGGGGLFFDGGRDYNSWFIKGYNRSHKLNLKLTGPDSYYNFQFMGWVK